MFEKKSRYVKIKLGFIFFLFICLKVADFSVRGESEGRDENQDKFMYIFIGIKMLTFIVENYMIYYFYQSGMEYVYILQFDEQISTAKARLFFSFISLVLTLGQINLNIISILYKANYLNPDLQWCGPLNSFKRNFGEYLEMMMPFVIGMFVLYTIYFLTDKQERLHDQDGTELMFSQYEDF